MGIFDGIIDQFQINAFFEGFTSFWDGLSLSEQFALIPVLAAVFSILGYVLNNAYGIGRILRKWIGLKPKDIPTLTKVEHERLVAKELKNQKYLADKELSGAKLLLKKDIESNGDVSALTIRHLEREIETLEANNKDEICREHF